MLCNSITNCIKYPFCDMPAQYWSNVNQKLTDSFYPLNIYIMKKKLFFFNANHLPKSERYLFVLKNLFLLLLPAMLINGCKKITEEPGLTSLCPIVVSTIPANGATGVSLNSLVTATFNKGIDPATINTSTFTLKQGTTPIAGLVTYSGLTAVFSPAVNFAPNTTYTGTITTGVRDSAHNAMKQNYVWSFTTGVAPDTIPPRVILTDPANGDSNVIITKVITATFSKVMNPATINTSTFILRQGTTVIPGTVTYSGSTASFAPAANLGFNTTYTATITTGAKDMSNNALVSNYIWSFTTAPIPPDVTPPTVIFTDPVNGATAVPISKTLSATFSEAMNPATINSTTFLLKQGATSIPGTVTYSGTTAYFIPSANLSPNTVYTATITTGAQDLAGNGLVTNYVWTFTTSAPDITPPTVISTDPPNGATAVPLNKIISATFSEAMNPATINNTTFLLKIGATPVSGTVSYSGTTAFFIPTGNLLANTVYTATITTGAKDLAGNALVSNYVWNFTTGSGGGSVILGTIALFGAFGGSAGITNQGLNTVINNGSIGTTGASTLVTGFHDGTTGDIYTETPLNKGLVTGRIYTAPPFPGTATSFAIATQGLLDATTAYNSISPASRPGGTDPGAGELGGLTLPPGVYKSASGPFKITNGNLTLDAMGNPNAEWIFQSPTSLTVGLAGPAGAKSVILINGALTKNVYWYVGSAATINGAGGGTMVGTIISSAGMTFSTAGNAVQTVLNGRAVSLNASVTMVNTTINVP